MLKALQRTPTCVRQVLCWRPSQKSHVATERHSLSNWRLFVCHAAGQWIGAGRCIIDTCKSTENNTTGTMGAGRHTCVCVCQKDTGRGKIKNYWINIEVVFITVNQVSQLLQHWFLSLSICFVWLFALCFRNKYHTLFFLIYPIDYIGSGL